MLVVEDASLWDERKEARASWLELAARTCDQRQAVEPHGASRFNS